METIIKGVSLLNQHGKKVYSFTLSAEAFLERGFVNRLADGKNEGAIQRDLIQSHVLNIAIAMLDETVLWPDSLVVALESEPSFIEGELHLPQKYKFSVDDGQHRWYALNTIKEMGKPLPKIEFQVFATYGLTVEERISLFKLQTQRKAVTRDFALALSAKAGQFKNESEARAHAVVMRLANDLDSPLKGHIALPGLDKPRIKECWLSPAVLVSMQKPMFARNAAWEVFDEEQATTSLKLYLAELRHMWINQWNDTESYSLRSNRGILALLAVFLSVRSTRVHVKSYTEPSEIAEFARYFSGFKWNTTLRGRQTQRIIENALSEYLAGAIERSRK